MLPVSPTSIVSFRAALFPVIPSEEREISAKPMPRFLACGLGMIGKRAARNDRNDRKKGAE